MDFSGLPEGHEVYNEVHGYDHTVGSPYWRTEVGQFELSDSPYGTFDQGGNIYEWNEAILHESYRGFRGGSFSLSGSSLHAYYRNFGLPTYE